MLVKSKGSPEMTDILSTVKIDMLRVPEVIANDCQDAVFECAYSGAADDVTVVWLHNGTQIYEWKLGAEPRVSGVLDGRLDLTYRLKNAGVNSTVEKRALRIVELTPELTGDYTCIVRSRGQEAKATKPMTVFSPERDFELSFSTPLGPDLVDIKCVAKRLHPQPDLIIEYNKVPIAQQQQRIWRKGAYYDTECIAFLPRLELRPDAEIACRLQLPQVDYTAITKKYLNFDKHVNGASGISLTYAIFSFFITIVYILL